MLKELHETRVPNLWGEIVELSSCSLLLNTLQDRPGPVALLNWLQLGLCIEIVEESAW